MQQCRARYSWPVSTSFRSHTRHVGRGIVIDEGRVTGTQTGGEHPTGLRLDLPVRVTVRHGSTLSIAVAFPKVLLERALGGCVDGGALAAAEIYSILAEPSGQALATHTLADPEPARLPVAAATEPERPTPAGRSRRRWLGAAAVVAAVATGTGWLVFGNGDAASSSASTRKASAPSSHPPGPRPSNPTQKATASAAPASSRKPNLTLTSDLAFGYDSATLSQPAREALRVVARQARAAGLEGVIVVDGYTDNLGSAVHGHTLSLQRADAVAAVLRGLLEGQPLRVIAVGRGEANPLASNATEEGRRQNRRVTLTLPKP